MDPIENNAIKIIDIRKELFYDDWALNWLINSCNELKDRSP